MPEYYAVERRIYQKPEQTVKPDGTSSWSMGFVVAVVDRWVVEPEKAAEEIALALNIKEDLDKKRPFQARVGQWLVACFGAKISMDCMERNHRFLEEALELVQACGCTKSEAHQLVDYVYGRPAGDRFQEIGGVMNTLAALCFAHGEDLDAAAEAELERVWGKIEQIRAKQAAKPKHGPLPGPSDAVHAIGVAAVGQALEGSPLTKLAEEGKLSPAKVADGEWPPALHSTDKSLPQVYTDWLAGTDNGDE